jgi:hypothetical protein
MKITSRDVAITSIIIIIGILIIATIIFVISNERQQEEKNKQAEEFIDQINKQTIDKNSEQAAQDQTEQKEEIKTFNAVLKSAQDDMLTITDEETGQIAQIYLTQSTAITYNNKSFDKINFYQGDRLSITAEKTSQNQWEAKSIVILFSASPNTEAPIPKGLEERPTGELKPLGL